MSILLYARHTVVDSRPFLAIPWPMKATQPTDRQGPALESQLLGINAKTAPYPAARSWSGGRKRIIGKGPHESHCYHIMSRTCGGEVFFDDIEKEALKRLIWRLADFCGVKLVTYCIMGNHFHLLVEVPKKDLWLQRFSGPQGEEKLMAHLTILYSKTYVALLQQDLAELRRQGLENRAQEKLTAIKKRFCDLSIYVKEVKERYSRWINKRRNRRGTLWMDRFKSVLVESGGEALRTMAAYIDLNPVRAKLVADPKDYRWSGYAEALSGSRRAQRGLCKALAKPVDGWKTHTAAEAYRSHLHASGKEIKAPQNESIARPGISVEKARQILAAKGKLSPAQLRRGPFT